MKPRHFLNISDFTTAELELMISLAQREITNLGSPLSGRGVALVFEKPSNRTRHSMEMAVVQLGGHPVYTRGEEVGFDVRESVEDVTQILAGYHAMIAARVFLHSVLERMTEVSTVPVVNMLSDFSHPLQACADALTMVQHVGPLSEIKVAWVGDYNNVARSLAEIVSKFGGQISFSCPIGFEPDSKELARLRSLGGTAEFFENPESAVRDAHVVHTDTWVSMGQEAETVARRKIFEPFSVTSELMSKAGSGAFFMHCMPAHRGEEVSAEVFDGPKSLVIAQGHNRMHAARGVLAFLSGVN